MGRLSPDLDFDAFRKVLGEIRPFKDRSGRRLQQAYHYYRRQAQQRAAGQRMLVTSAARWNQALVKIVPKGGARSGKALADQAAYLSREHTLRLEDSGLGDFGGEMSVDEVAEKIAAWEKEFTFNPKFGHTTHIVVSFPKGTTVAAAKRAAEDFGVRAFESGLGGDSFDYFSVQHTDTDYPHTHFVVKNRGMFAGEWFTIRRGTAHEPQALRELQAEVSKPYGIKLSATTRLERGIREKPVTTPEYRAAQAEGRKPRPQPLSEAEAVVVDYLIDERADAYGALATAYEAQSKDIANLLKDAENILREGTILMKKDKVTALPDIDEKADKAINEIDQARARLSESLARNDALMKQHITDPQHLALAMVRNDKLKAKASAYLPERPDLKVFAVGGETDAFNKTFELSKREDLKDHSATIEKHYDRAREAIKVEALKRDLDPTKVLAQYSVNTKVTAETARRWEMSNMKDMRDKNPSIDEATARVRLAELNTIVRDQINGARANIRDELAPQGVKIEADMPKPLRQQVRDERKAREEAQARDELKPRPRPKP